METNTVILSVQEYNELRDFKKAIEDGKNVLSLDIANSVYKKQYFFLTPDETITSIREEANKLSETINNYEQIVADLRHDNVELQQQERIRNRQVAKMTCYEFRRWRKTHTL